MNFNDQGFADKLTSLLSGLPIIILLVIASPFNVAMAQTISLGSTGVYGDDIDAFGINIRGYYNSSNHRWCFGPELTVFDKSETIAGENVNLSLVEYNANGHYVFEVTEKLGLNAIAGINYSVEKERDGDHGNELLKEESAWGLLTGVGFHYFLHHRFVMIGEYDHLFSDLRQNTFTLGLLYTIPVGKKKGHHE